MDMSLNKVSLAEGRQDGGTRKGVLAYQASALFYLDYSDIFRPVSFVV
jgi:hypothetical protein